MTDYLEIRALVIDTINCDNTTKQEIGRRFAVYLGLEPGPLGSDDGIDGIGLHNERKIHFQCRLKGEELDKDDARAYYSDIEYHRVDVSMMLAGIGYKDTFTERLYGHGNISRYKIHLLTLGDLFEESPAFQEALKDLPLQGDISSR